MPGGWGVSVNGQPQAMAAGYQQAVPRNALGVRYDADKYGMDTMTALSRDQWDTYLQTFMPMENNLIRYATDISKPAVNAERAIEQVGQSFEQQTGMQERRMKAYGIQATDEEKAALSRSTALNKGLAEVQAGNMARDATIRRQRSVLGTGGEGGLV